MLKTLNMAGIRRPVGFCGGIIAVFKLKNASNWHRNRQKPKIFKHSKFLCSFCQFFDRLRGWNVKDGHQRKTLLSSRFFRRLNCGFQVEKISNWHRI